MMGEALKLVAGCRRPYLNPSFRGEIQLMYLLVVRNRRYMSFLAIRTTSSDASSDAWFMHHGVSSRVWSPVCSISQEFTATNVSKLLWICRGKYQSEATQTFRSDNWIGNHTKRQDSGHLKKRMVQGNSCVVLALIAERNLSKTRNRRRWRIPGCLIPLAKVLPKKSTSELGRRIVQILVWPPIGPSATIKGSLLLPISFFTVANSSVAELPPVSVKLIFNW